MGYSRPDTLSRREHCALNAYRLATLFQVVTLGWGSVVVSLREMGMGLEVRCGQKTCGNKREMRHPKRAKSSLRASEASKAKNTLRRRRRIISNRVYAFRCVLDGRINDMASLQYFPSNTRRLSPTLFWHAWACYADMWHRNDGCTIDRATAVIRRRHSGTSISGWQWQLAPYTVPDRWHAHTRVHTHHCARLFTKTATGLTCNAHWTSTRCLL